MTLGRSTQPIVGGALKAVGKTYSRATSDARFVGTEYVVDAHGIHAYNDMMGY